jgi:hypothetical protein
MLGAFLPGILAFALTLVPMMITTTFLLYYSYHLYQQETKS